MSQAKTASKNNPLGRQKAKEYTYGGKKIKPVRYISLDRNFMAAQYEGGQVILDAQQQPMAWSKVASN